MKASDLVKTYGLESLNQLAEVSGVSVQTLSNWFNNPKKRTLFELVALGAVVRLCNE